MGGPSARVRCLLFALLSLSSHLPTSWSRESFRSAEPKETTNRSPRSIIFFSETELSNQEKERKREREKERQKGKEKRNSRKVDSEWWMCLRRVRREREREREGIGAFARARASSLARGFRRDCKNNIWPTLS